MLENLGPSMEVEDFPEGDYLLEVVEPKDPSDWTRENKDDDDPAVVYKSINWPLQIIEPEEYEGRRMFFNTMFYASEAAIAKARAPYDPRSMTYNFLVALGVADRVKQESGKTEIVIRPEFMTDNKPDLNKMIGVRVKAKYEDVKIKKGNFAGQIRRQVTQTWRVS